MQMRASRPARVLAMLALLPAQVGAAPAIEPLVVTEIAAGIYLRQGVQEVGAPANRGHIANLGFVVGDERVAVIDAGATLREGQALRAAVRRVTELPISYLVLTHVHPDHLLGAAAFAADRPTIIGHRNLPEAISRRGGYSIERQREILGEEADGIALPAPEVGVVPGEGLTLDLGGRLLALSAHPTAHSNNDLSLFDRASGTLWLSDLLFVERIPVIDGSLLGWLRVIDRLAQIDAARAVPGHGPVRHDWRAALAQQRRYLEAVADGVRRVIAARGSIGEAVASVARDERDRWLLFDDYHGRNVTAAFVELEWE